MVWPEGLSQGTIGHAITTEEQLSTLQCIRNHLTDSGVFLFDVYPGDKQYEHAEFKENPVSLPDGTTVERHGEIHSNMLDKIMTVDLQYTVRDPEGNILEEVEVASSNALLFDRDVDHLISLSGFVVVDELGGFDGQSYSSESGRRILFLKKSKEKRWEGVSPPTLNNKYEVKTQFVQSTQVLPEEVICLPSLVLLRILHHSLNQGSLCRVSCLLQ